MTFTCNKERMLRLVEALESGEYSQTSGTLRSRDDFCCLGVACDLAAKEGLGSWVDYRDFTRFLVDGVEHGADLPHAVQALYGLVGDYELRLAGTTAMHLNDEGHSFAGIAAAIRRDYDLGPAPSLQH